MKQIKMKLSNKYIGEKVNSKKEGFGILTWLDGTNYIGTFKNGHAHGYGCFQHQDGDNYIGSSFINFPKGNFQMIRRIIMEFTRIQVERIMKDYGQMINNMG